MVHQLACIYGAGIEPQQNLIANALLLILTDERFSGDVLDGNLTVRDALDEVLYQDAPMANYGISYPPYPVQIDGVWLPADQPVLISFSACNNDPAIASDQRAGNRAHLAWSGAAHLPGPVRRLPDRPGRDRPDPGRPARTGTRGAGRAARVAAGALRPGTGVPAGHSPRHTVDSPALNPFLPVMEGP